MLAEIRLVIAQKEARLLLKHGEKVVEDEVWNFDGKVSATEAKEVISVAFHEAYDLMNTAVHGE